MQFVALSDAVCCMLYSLMYVVVKFCFTVQFVVLSDAVVSVLWCGFVLRWSLLYYLMQLFVCCGAVCCMLFCS